MSCFALLILNLVFTGILILVVLMIVIYRKQNMIKQWWRKYNVKKFLVSVLLPSLIPFIISIVSIVDTQPSFDFHTWIRDSMSWFLISMCVISAILFVFQYKEWVTEHRDRKIEWINEIYRHAYYSLYDALKSKTSAYRTRALKSGHGFLSDSDIGYDVFEHIRTICGAYRLAVANMTHIPTTHITVSFIYHYTYSKANSKDREWRWIIGKDSNFNVPLDDFIARDETLYHYIINNNIDSAFYNDKKQASEDCKYYFSSKDNLHEREGSIVATKFSFSSNAEKCCEGIIMITTYGQKFIRDDSEHTPKEFEQLLEHEIFPCYKNLLKVELGTLYFRHKTEKESCSIEKVMKSWLDKNR